MACVNTALPMTCVSGAGGVPSGPVVDLSDDVTAISSPGCGWHGSNQHTHSQSHWEDLMEILAGFAAVRVFFISPLSAEIIACLFGASNASVTFTTGLIQPSVSLMQQNK